MLCLGEGSSRDQVGNLGAIIIQTSEDILTRLGGLPEAGSKDIATLARLGASGRYPGNMHAQLLSNLGEPVCVKPVVLETLKK